MHICPTCLKIYIVAFMTGLPIAGYYWYRFKDRFGKKK